MAQLNDEQLEYVVDSLHQLDFGSINITVHDGQITQIDQTAKKRFPAKPKVRRQSQLHYQTKK